MKMKKPLFIIEFSITILIILSFNIYLNWNNHSKYSYSDDLIIPSEYIYPNDVWTIKVKALCDGKEIKFKNELLMKNDVIFAEAEDIAENFNLILELQDDNNGGNTFVLKRYELNLYLAIDEELAGKTIVDIGFDSILPETPFVAKKRLVYLPLFDVLNALHYETTYNFEMNEIDIKDYDNRDNLSWKEIYFNIINDYLNVSKIKQERYKANRYVEQTGLPADTIYEDYKKIDSSGGRYEFSLHDFTGDGIPELLLSTHDTGYFYPHYLWKICYWLNPKTKVLELKFGEKPYKVSCIGYDDDNRMYAIINDFRSIGTEYDENGNFIRHIDCECYKWDNNKNEFIFVEMASYSNNKIYSFSTYGGTSLIDGEIDVKGIIDSYSDLPETIYIDGVKIKINNKNVIFTGHEPIIESSTVYVPVKDVFEAMGYKVVWLNNGSPEMLQVGKSNSGVLITKEEELYFLPSEGKMVNINRKLDVIDDYNPIVVEETFMLPYGWIERLTGAEVIWENPSIGKLNTIYINLK